MQPPSPQALAHHVGVAYALHAAKSHERPFRRLSAHGGVEQALCICRRAVGAEGGSERRQGCNTCTHAGRQREEGEPTVDRGTHLLHEVPPRRNLQPAVQRVEACQVSALTDDIDAGQLAGQCAHPSLPFGVTGQVVQYGHVEPLQPFSLQGRCALLPHGHLHLVVGIGLNAPLQRPEVGMGCRGHYCHAAAPLKNLHRHCAAVVRCGQLCGDGR